MALNILLSQKTSRHVVKKLDSAYDYQSVFGTFGTAKTDDTGLNHPMGIAVDASNNVYICDSENSRIVKLDSNLAFVSSVNLVPAADLPNKRNTPYCILFDSVSSDLYVVGVYRDIYLSICRITTSLTISKANYNIYSVAKERPFSICKGFTSGDFIISLGTKLVKVAETSNGTFTATTVITNEAVNPTAFEAIRQEKKFNTVNKPVVPASYTFWRTYTEAPTYLTDITFQTLHFPILGTPDTDFYVYKNGVELDYDPLLDDPNDYTINQTTGLITLQKEVIESDEIRIRYKYQMIENTDYVLDIYKGSFVLAVGVTQDWNGNRDLIQIDYTYNDQAVEQTITGLVDATVTGLVKHSNGDIYIAQNTLLDKGKISRVNSSYINIGDSNKISKYIIGLYEAIDTSLLTYDSSNQKIVRYNSFLNYVEDVYEDKKVVDDPAVSAGSHQYQLQVIPILDKSEKVFVGAEILPIAEYDLNYTTGLLTIQQIQENPVPYIIARKVYQLSKYPVESGSEEIYVGGTLKTSGYTLDYPTGRLEFPDYDPESFEIGAGLVPTQDIQTTLSCVVDDVVRFMGHDLPTPLLTDTDYYVVYQDGAKIRVSLTPSGSAISITLLDPNNPDGKGSVIVMIGPTGDVTANYYRDITVSKVQYKCTTTQVEHDAFDIHGVTEVDI
jgi:hypothetical protein